MGNKRTIIIVWSWNSAGIGEGVWQIAGTINGTDQVICYDWPVSQNEDLEQLELLVRQHTQHGGDVMLFLHRYHGYHQEHIKQLLNSRLSEQQGKLQCFLFGEGSDAIYLTSDPRGLLGTSGTFSAQLKLSDGQSVSVSAIADADRRMLKSSHFDYVWELYQLALRRRIFELKEDIFNCLGQFLPRQTFAAGELYDILRQAKNRELMLRLLSFVGRVRKGSNLAKEIRIFEQNNNRTLTFDDCGIQLETSYGTPAAEQHALLAAYVLRHVLAKGDAVSLIELRERFEDLLLQIPGLTYHS